MICVICTGLASIFPNRSYRLLPTINFLPEETIEKMASTYTEGYRKGFEIDGARSLKEKDGGPSAMSWALSA